MQNKDWLIGLISVIALVASLLALSGVRLQGVQSDASYQRQLYQAQSSQWDGVTTLGGNAGAAADTLCRQLTGNLNSVAHTEAGRTFCTGTAYPNTVEIIKNDQGVWVEHYNS